ncbi:phosphotransferase family protein [Rhodalgimonas zhirmunskyi]|uniref:Aminoglycoside phosphotransferase family protein n=1 Tax=Rhodalgimonas zhirmunskyi TaxID=2964767 RepID=A0AAJ1U718_9RHOB|nr:phosphotransferase [Rhodoalgimonas zhirmunskyi]MDQ2094220.1 aminoglycoside phosphotransferase family protein [Rhodoalgimonas zhirmunskyi]
MNVVNKSNIELFPEQALAALTRLEALLTNSPLKAEVDEALRLVPGKRAIFRGRLNDRDVVFRLPLDASNRDGAAKEWDEIARARHYMSASPYRVVEPLHFDPDTGLSIIEYIPGPTLMRQIRKVTPAEGVALQDRAAQWLHAYCVPSFKTRKSRGRWLEKAAQACEKQTHKPLRAPEAEILRLMTRLDDMLAETDSRAAIGHGDFHLGNLMTWDDSFIGIDTGGSGRLPIYKDMARAMTHAVRRGVLPSGQRRFGVDATWVDSFARAFALSGAETTLSLPYFLCFETLFRVEHPQMDDKRIALALDMEESLLADLRNIV